MSPFRSAQILFAVVFVFSILVLFFTLGGLAAGLGPQARTPTAPITPGARPTPTPVTSSPEPGLSEPSYFLTIVLPLLSALVSVVGFVSSTLLAWRKERREAQVTGLELERTRLELEKARFELEKLKAEKRREE